MANLIPAAPPDVQRFLRAAATDAERSASTVRAVLLVGVMLRLFLLAWDEMLAGVFKHWFSTAVLLTGLALSVGIIRYLRTREATRGLLVASTLLDSALAFSVVLPSLLWPRATYLGVIAAPDVMIWPLVAIGAGFRLSVPAARLGAAAACLGLGSLIAIDLVRNADTVRYGPMEVVLAVVLISGAALLAFAIDNRQRRLVIAGAGAAVQGERVRQRFGAYMSEEVALMVLGDDAGAPYGVQRDVAVLFSDLRGFTHYSEQLAPEALVSELNAYFDAMLAEVQAEGGTVDKFVGDAIMVVFGLPTARGDETCRAIRCAQRMHAALERHNGEREQRNQPPLAQGIGVHYGRVVAGPVGTRERLQFTVIGDTVNVASRLESVTKEVGRSTLVSGDAAARAAAEGGTCPPLEELDALELRGRTAQTRLFALAR